MKPFLYTYLFFFGFLSSLQAQQNQTYFEKYDVKSGLPESSVNTIVEDHLGYIWMATQNGLVRYDGYHFKVYQLGSKKTNLDPSTSPRSIFIDSNKTLWISTRSNGLFKYNRKTDTFTQFVYPENDIRTSYFINTEDKAGNLWGTATKDGTESYLWKLDKSGKFEFFGKQFKNKNYINASRIYSAFTSKSGKIWIASSNGFYSYEGKNKPLKGYATSTNPDLFRETVNIYEPPSEPNIFWMVTYNEKYGDHKIVRFDSKTNNFTEFTPNFGIETTDPNKKIDYASFRGAFYYSMYEDKQQQLWFTGSDRVIRLNRKTNTLDYFITGFKYEKEVETKWLGNFTATNDGKLLLGSPFGLVAFDPKTAQFERYVSNPERPGSILKNSDLRKIMIDHTGALWVGFGWAGANKSDRKKTAFTIYKHNPKELNSYPKEGGVFAAGEKGHLWFTDSNFIYKWNQNSNSFSKTFSADADEHYDGRGCLTKEGNFYIATEKHLVFYNTKTGKKEKYAYDTTLPEYFLNNPIQDYNGLIWLDTNDKGIVSFNPKIKKFKHYPYRENQEKITPQNAGWLDDGRVLVTYVDRQHNFWVGTNYGSLNLYDPIKDCFINYSDTNDKSLTCINSIYEDTSGRFWVGTYQSGLFNFDRKKRKVIRNLNEKNGLLFNSAFGINEDATGQLWLTSERGLSRVNPKDLAVKNFPLCTILPESDFARETQGLFKLDNGKFMSMLMDGVVVFDPAALKANSYPPKVNIENIAVINPEAKTDEFKTILTYGKKEIELSYEQNRIQFNYVGLHFDNPEANTYAYKLDGYDDNWVQAGTQRTVTYTNLSPGTYTFHVKAANSDGVWSTDNAAIKIIISPPWWQTWWAYLLYLVVFVSIIRAYIVYRAKNLKRENAILEEKVSHRTNQLTKSIEDLKTTQNQLIQSEKMASLGELTAGIAHEIQNPLNFVNNFSEVSLELIDEMHEEMAKGDTDEANTIAADIKQNLEKINYHGKRADGIVKGMLQHSRSGSTTKEPTDINKLADEYLRLAYHGLRAKDKSFNADLVTDFNSSLPKVNVLAQDMGRVLLNLFTNAFYATHQRQKQEGEGYKPVVSVTTSQTDNYIEIKVKDNGVGIPDSLKDKILQPFFTTKPTGEGTGLGLSLSYDIVVKGHNGKILIDSKEKEYTIFTIQIPIE